MSDIFLSYASEDREQAERLARALETQNLSVWWDRTILPDRPIDEVIEEAIAAARSMVVLWSNVSVGKNWVLEQATDGRERGILIPVLIDEVQPPRGFRLLQTADLSDWDGTGGSREFLSLLRRVERVLGRSRGTPSVPESTEVTQPVSKTETSSLPVTASNIAVNLLPGGKKRRLSKLGGGGLLRKLKLPTRLMRTDAETPSPRVPWKVNLLPGGEEKGPFEGWRWWPPTEVEVADAAYADRC